MPGKPDLVPADVQRPGNVVDSLGSREAGLFEEEERVRPVTIGGIQWNFLDDEILGRGLDRSAERFEISEQSGQIEHRGQSC